MANHQQTARSNNGLGDGFTNSGLFAENPQQHFHQGQNYDDFFISTPANHTFSDHQQQAWSVNAGFPSQHQPHPESRAIPSPHAWHQQTNHARNSPQAFQTHANTPNNPPASQNYPGSLSQSPAPFAQNVFPRYGTPQQQQHFPYQTPHYDPPLFNAMYPTYGNAPTIAPQALNQNHGPSPHNTTYYQTPDFTNSIPIHLQQSTGLTQNIITPQALVNKIPRGELSGIFTIIDENKLGQAINSERVNTSLHVTKLPLEWPVQTTPEAGKAKTKGKGAKPEDESDDDSDMSSDDEDEPQPLKSERPSDQRGQARYDTIKAVWRPKGRGVEGTSIRKALSDFWDIIKSVRDHWKTDQAAVVKAQGDKKKASDIAFLESRVVEGRDRFEAAFKAVLEFGHPDIIEWFSENNSLLFICYQFLLDRIKNEDYNGPIVRNVLDVLSRCATLTDAKLEKTNLGKLFARFSKNGNARTSGFVKRIVAKAAEGTKAEAEKPAALKSDQSASNDKPTPTTVAKRTGAEAATGTKRPASTPAEGVTAKKVATGVSKLNGASTTSKTTAAATAATGGKKISGTGEGDKLTTVKAKPAVTKAGSNFFASLQSAAKKPGTSIKNAPATGPSKPAEKKDAWSLQDTLNNLSKAKEKEKVETKPEKVGPPETEEDRARRLRKEARRALRVKFKADSELVQIHVFTHFPEEEEGHDSSQKRDVSDRLQEGLQLKMGNSMMDDEDEDEEEPVLIAFKEPSDVDMSAVVYAEGYSADGNYDAHAGTKPIRSEEREERERQNRSILEVHYTQESDIPRNPKEPASLYTGPPDTDVRDMPWPDPNDEKVPLRIRRMLASWAPRASTNTNAALNGGVLGSILNQQQQPPAPHQQQQQQHSGYGMGQPAQAQASITPELANALAQLRQLSSNATPTQPPQTQNPSLMGFAASQPAAVTTAAPVQQPVDIGAILASLQQSGQIPASQPTALASSASGHPPQAILSQAQQFTSFDSTERKRMWDGELDDGPLKKKVPYNYKTRTCLYWKKGKCSKGDNCTFAHEDLPE